MWKWKVPWGIIAGICAMAVFFTTVGVIAAFIVLNSIAGQTGSSTTLFGEWYQTVLFIADILFFAGLIASAVLWFVKRKKTEEGN